ncbi:MAG: DNA polymerase III subunit alpha, partial [Dolichospermum sp.]
MSFVPLHIHSDYSLLDGASQLPELVDRAIALGMKAIALTDHGVMYGAVELIKICRSKMIKPIIGNEMYIINGDIEKQERRPKYHQVVLAKNTQGYKNLVKITTISHLQGVQGKGIFSRPCINKDLLKQYKEGLIVTSACLGGEIPQAILSNRPDIARKIAKWYKEVFGEDFYLEIQDHGSQEDRIVNVEIVKIARELNIKFIATNDSHFISCFDVESHDALLCIQTGKLISEDKRMRYSGTEYLKSSEEMHQLFRDHLADDIIAEAIATTEEIADKVEPYHIMGDPQIPTPTIPSGHTADTYAEEVAWLGLLERLNRKSRNEVDPVYKERLEYELKMIQQMGFSKYFLVVWDYIKFARDNNIPVGPGRGSAAGSLVAYAMKITNIDPVHHGLLFERFLNPERKSMPDIDTDFCIDKRDQVIEYVTEKYGVERVAQIITFNRLTSKAVLKDVARVLDIPYGDSDKMAKMIPVVRGKPTKLKVMISDETPEPEFKAKYDNDPTVRRWIDMAMRIEGTNKTFGVHAAGVVISAEPLDELVPLQRNNDGSVITQYFMEDLESLGLLKMDFLGLRNLTLIQKTIDLIQQSQGYRIDADEITKQERKAQKILAKGEHTSLPKDVTKAYS